MNDPKVYQFKYSADVFEIEHCPSKKIKNEIELAFRFAFSDLADNRNILPVAKTAPHRILKNGAPASTCCEAYGLSMYPTLELLKQAAVTILKTSPKFLSKRVGDHYIVLKLKPESGKHTEPNQTGHFTFFEDSSFKFPEAVSIHGKLDL